MTNFYDRGDVVRLTANFTNLAGSAADPSSVTLRIKQPDNSVVTYNFPGTLTKDSTGQYHYDFAITESGDIYYRFEGTGDVQAAGENLFHVRVSNII